MGVIGEERTQVLDRETGSLALPSSGGDELGRRFGEEEEEVGFRQVEVVYLRGNVQVTQVGSADVLWLRYKLLVECSSQHSGPLHSMRNSTVKLNSLAGPIYKKNNQSPYILPKRPSVKDSLPILPWQKS